MSEQNEIPQEEITKPIEPISTEPAEETVGDIMQRMTDAGLKYWVIAVSALVYLAGIVYAEVHGLTMLRNGVAEDMRIWATVGMIAAGVTAVALPLALKVWTIEAKQRIAAYMFYALDFAFLTFNAFTDFNVNTGQALAPWAQSYVTYILPASPIVVAAGWALIWELDPSVKEKVLRLSLRAAMKEKMARKVADAAKGQQVTDRVNDAAEREVERALTELFGAPVTAYRVRAEDLPRRDGWLQRFFGLLSGRERVTSSQDTRSQSNPSPSDQDEQ